MRYLRSAALILLPAAMWAGGRITLPKVTVGHHLQAPAAVTLDAAAVGSDLPVKLTSSDPGRILLSTSPETAGSASITVTVRAGSRLSREFYVHGLASSGDVAYTASAPGCEGGTG